MKKLLKIAGYAVLAIVILLVSVALFVNFRGIPSYPTEEVRLDVEITSEKIQRGRKLATMLCSNCHKNPKTGNLTGTKMLDAPPEFGTIYTPNITQDPTYGIGTWSDGEIAFLLRTGIRKNGQYAPPYMPKFPKMADSDIEAIIAYLKSNEKEVRADPTPDKSPEPSFLTKFLCMVAFKPLPMTQETLVIPDSADVIELGKYYAHNLDCYACHSKDFKTINPLEPEKSEGYFVGGNKPLGRTGDIVLTQNLTPDPKTGIGNWSKEKFIKAVKYGLKENEPALRYPMMPYIQLEDYEVGAIYDYLMTLEPVENLIERSPI